MRHLSSTLTAIPFLTMAVTACGDSPTNDLVDDDATGEQDASDTFTPSSRAVVDGELLAECQCEEKVDGVEESTPLEWSGVPDGTESLATTVHHSPVDPARSSTATSVERAPLVPTADSSLSPTLSIRSPA